MALSTARTEPVEVAGIRFNRVQYRACAPIYVVSNHANPLIPQIKVQTT